MNTERPESQPSEEIAHTVDHRKHSRPNAQQGKRIPEETKALALAVYAETGSVNTAARAANLPETTVRNWIDRDPEIDAKLEALRVAIRHHAAHLYAEIAVRAAEELLDRVNNGDVIKVDDQGVMTRRPIPGRELAFITSMAADKHALLTATAVKQTEDASLTKLADGLLAAMEKRARAAKAVDAPQHENGGNSGD